MYVVLISSLRQIQRKCLGHVLRHNSLLKATGGDKVSGRPREMLLERILKKELTADYSN